MKTMNRFRDKPILLCVDDDPYVLRSLERLFQGEPVKVLSTLEPERALQWVETWEVRLLLTDQRMPGMTGTKLIEEVMCRSPGTACLLLTAYPSDANVLPDFLQDTYDLVAKPWHGPTLKSRVRQILRERRLEDEEDPRRSGQ